MTDSELLDLKARVISAMGTGAQVGRATEYLLNLITEVEAHRKKAAQPKPLGGMTLHVGEMDVKKAEPPPPAEPPVQEAASDESPVEEKSSKEKSEKSAGKSAKRK